MAPMASTPNDTAPMTQTGGEGAWMAEPPAAISIFFVMSMPGIAPASALASPLGLTVSMPCFR